MSDYINTEGIDRVLRRLEKEIEADKAEERQISKSKSKHTATELVDSDDDDEVPDQPEIQQPSSRTPRRTLLDSVNDIPDHGDIHRADSRQKHHGDSARDDETSAPSFQTAPSRAPARFETMTNSELLSEIDKGLSTRGPKHINAQPSNQHDPESHQQPTSRTASIPSVSNSTFLGQHKASPTAASSSKSARQSRKFAPRNTSPGPDSEPAQGQAALTRSDWSLSSSISSGMDGLDAGEVEREIRRETEERRRQQYRELRRIMVPRVAEWRWWEAGMNLMGRGEESREGARAAGATGRGGIGEGASSRARNKEGAGRRQEGATGCETGGRVTSHGNRVRVPDGKVRLGAGKYLAFTDDEDGSWCMLEYC